MAVFTIISIVGAVVAVVMKENSKQLYISCGVVFSAGVLLAGGFVHLLFDSDEQFHEMGIDNFPWALSIAGATIMGLACFEIVLDRAVGKYVTRLESKEENNSQTPTEMPTTVAPIETQYRIIPDQETQEDAFIEEDHGHMHVDPANSFSAIILTLALSVHSIVEGLGIGASSGVSSIQSAFIAVVAHRGFTSFSLAQGMVTSGYWEDHSKRRYFYISIGTFIFVNLLGIAIGWGVSSSSKDNALTAVLIGITAGSFIYVAVVEILPQETKTIKRETLSLPPVLFSFIAGYCLMAMLAIWV